MSCRIRCNARARLPRCASRCFLALALTVWSLVLGGCVFLRLLQLKNQLAQFDRYIETDSRDGLKIMFKEPVMLDDDVEGFFKWIPESREKVGSAEKWHFRWLKDRVAADGNHPPYAVEFDLLFSEHKLKRMSISESFFATVLPKKYVVGILRSFGRAKVDQKNRSATATVEERDLDPEAEDPSLTREMVAALIGQPVSTTEDDASPQWHYRFMPAANQRAGRGGSEGEILATFTFEAGSRVRKVNARTPWGNMGMDFGPVEAAEAPNASEAKK